MSDVFPIDDRDPFKEVKKVKNVKMNKRGVGLALAIILGIPLLLVGGCGYVVTSVPYSEGYRDGDVQKFSRKGIIRHSYEGDLALPGSNRVSSVGNVWHFTVKDPTIAKALLDLPPFTPVRLHYKEYIWSWNAETNYRVTKIEVLNDTGQGQLHRTGANPPEKFVNPPGLTPTDRHNLELP